MEEKQLENDVKTRLVLSGLKELEEHGIADFSLRRVASAAEVSCAAPYRHFKDKDEMIVAIISYVREGWTLLAEEIFAVCTDLRDRILRLADAAFRFWVANSNFRSALVSGESSVNSGRRAELIRFDAPILSAIEMYAEERKRDASQLKFLVPALIYGSVTLVGEGIYETSDAAKFLREHLDKEL